MKSEIIIAIVVLVTVAAHVAIYRWVKFKIHEGVILRFLREPAVAGAVRHHNTDAIAAGTDIPVARVSVVCSKSVEIHPDPSADDSWSARVIKV